jgi:hypothetical protein
METFFLVCVALGGAVLVIQVVLSLLGMVAHLPDAIDDVAHGGGALHALDLLSVRAVSAAAVVFGATGMGLSQLLPPVLAAVSAAPLGLFAAVVTAYVTRLMLRLESDGSLRLDGAVGQQGTVYLPVPGAGAGTGLVQFPLQGRTVELRAFTRDPGGLPTGSSVFVISVDLENETVEVVSTSSVEGIS